MEKRAIFLLPILGWVGLVICFLVAVLSVGYPADAAGESSGGALLTTISAFVAWIFYGLLVWSGTLTLAFIARRLSKLPTPE